MANLPQLVDNVDIIERKRLTLVSDLEIKKTELRSSPLYQDIIAMEAELKLFELQKEEHNKMITDAMQDAGLKSFDTLDGRRLLIKKSPWSCKITNEDLLDDRWKKEKTTIAIDKKAILEELRNWGKVAGADIEYTFSLQISNKWV